MARVHIGQVIISIHTKLQNKEHVTEAQLRAKFMFPGHQEIHISKNWGFTKFNADEYENMAAEKRLIPDGCGVKYIPSCGLLDKRLSLMRALALSPPYSCPPINPTFLSKKKKNHLAFSDFKKAYGGGRVRWGWRHKVKHYIIIKLTNCQHRERWRVGTGLCGRP